MEALIPWIKSLLPKAAAWLAPRIPSLCSRVYLWLGVGAPKWVYKRWLINRFRDMPFIYQDLRLEVLNDFVELNLSSLDSSTLASHRFNAYDTRNAIQKMRDYRRGLFLGEGGIGKTTFFRFATLNMAGASGGEIIINESENIIPIFVPLKTLDNSSDNPLIDALTDCNPYLGRNRAKAFAKLLRLASLRRVALFLDGFDEVPYAGGNQNLAQELAALFSPLDEPLGGVIGRSRYADFYKAARGCRVYLSSRREFFLAHPISAPRDVPRWAVVEMTDKRASLVGNIFRHYKEKDGHIFLNALNVEEFMRQLSLARDRGFEQLSGNPLFLTVICFIYVNEIRSGIPQGEIFKGNSSDLVERCIKLLLDGIDRAKTSGLSEIDARALMNRRSAWSDQKFEALQYVASQMYLNDLGSLSLDILNRQLLKYFRSNPQLHDCDLILRGLSKNDPLTNIAIQLTLSGVFVVVDRRAHEALYDFPHRSFKEKLAIAHFTTASGILEITRRIGDPSFHELILLVAETPVGWPAVIDAIRSGLRELNGVALDNLLLQSLERSATNGDAAAAAKDIVEMAIRDKSRKLFLPRAIQKYLPSGNSYNNTLLTILGEVVRSGDVWAFALVAEALFSISQSSSATMSSIQAMMSSSSDMDWQLLYIVSSTEKSKDYENLERCLSWVTSRRSINSINDTLAGIFFVALIGKPQNRDSVRKCIGEWLHLIGDDRSACFIDDDAFGAVFDIYATTSDGGPNDARSRFARGAVPTLLHPWR